MLRYLHLFETESEFNSAYTGADYTEPWVSYTEEVSAVTYNKHVVPLEELVPEFPVDYVS